MHQDPRVDWAVQAAEQQRHLAEAHPDAEQRAHWGDDGTDAGGVRSTGRLSRIVDRIRRALRR